MYTTPQNYSKFIKQEISITKIQALMVYSKPPQYYHHNIITTPIQQNLTYNNNTLLTHRVRDQPVNQFIIIQEILKCRSTTKILKSAVMSL